MAKELSSIIAQAAQVRDASQREENTATRVGGVLCDLIEYLAEQITAGNIRIVSDSNGTGLSVIFYNNEGQAVAQRQNIPVVSSTIHGLMSPTLLTLLNTAFSQSDTNKTAVETRRLEIEELSKRLRGISNYSNAFTDPLLFLGDLDTMEEVNSVIDGMVTETASPQTKFTGHSVVNMQGCRFDIHQYAISFAVGNFVQCVCGCLKLSDDASSLVQDGKYNMFFRSINDFVPENWQGITSLIPYANEMYYGLLDPRDKMKLNNVVDLGHVTTSATAENWAKMPSYLTQKQRPTIFQYFDTRNQQVGMIVSLPASANTFGQTLLLGTKIYRRTVTVNDSTSTATSWTEI